MTDESNEPVFTFKAIGHQWYWEYEYSVAFWEIKGVLDTAEGVDSLLNKSLRLRIFRLLDVSENLFIPIKCQIRLLILSDDVIHSFAVPSLGVKVDAIPGRLNQINLLINRPGLYYGQCSEICGVNHRFIPIVIESTDLVKFVKHIFLD